MKNYYGTIITFFFIIILIIFESYSAIIKSGDVLEIIVKDHPELSGKFTVTENGTIDYPLLSEELVVNITTSELMNNLTIKLARHIENPFVIISVVDKPEIVVYVLGQVKNPGPVKTYLGATVQEVIQLAGGPLESANLEKIKIIYKNSQNADGEYFNLKAFSLTGNMKNMPRLKANDVVVVMASEKSNKVKVIGAVNKPGFYELSEKMNVFELIYMAGGPTERGDLSKVRRFSQKPDGKTLEEVINVQSYLDKGEMDALPQIMPGDIIMIYERWYDWRTILSIMNNVLLFIVTIQAFGGVFK
jgi:protein involved in polysaccharide export with SLBB domain